MSELTQTTIDTMNAEDYSTFLAYGDPVYQELDPETAQLLEDTVECIDLTQIESCLPSVLEFKY